MTPPKIDIFIAYARADKPYLKELRKQLRILERNRTVNKIWYDGEIMVGQTWEATIQTELENADIFLLLLSADFINSDYAYGKEMQHALERHRKGQATVIPIIARACNWDMTPLAELQAPVDGKALGSLPSGQRDPLYRDIVKAIAKAAEAKRIEKANLQRYFQDQKAWEKTLQLNSITAYENYLEQHPNGKHTAAASQAIAKIEEQQQEQQDHIERKAWREAQRLHTQASYQDYIKSYPKGQYTDQAKSNLFQLIAEYSKEVDVEDHKAFQAAKTIEDYRAYLANPLYGKYQKKAEQAIRRLESPSASGEIGKKVGIGVGVVLLLCLVVWMSGGFSGEKDVVSDPAETAILEEVENFAFVEPEMVFVEGGTFTMGCKEGRDENCNNREKPAHKVTINDFYIGKYEVTNEEFCAFLNEKGNQEEGGTTWLDIENEYCQIERKNNFFTPKSAYEQHPVVKVSWYGAAAYCKRLREKTGKNYRLPSEAEWEYAARGGNQSKDFQYAGSNDIGEVAWYRGNSGGRTKPVGSKKANELGVHDMSGNVYEWCADYWNESYEGAPTGDKAWKRGDSARRVIRGGSWNIIDNDARVSYRFRYLTDYRLNFTGFRIAW